MRPRTYRATAAAISVISLSLGMSLLSFQPATAAIVYIIKDLGAFSTSPTGYNAAKALNDSGQVVGHAFLDNIGDRGFLYSGGLMHDLGAYPVSGYTQTYPLAINNSGKIVGYAAKPLGSSIQGFSSTGGPLAPLSTFILAAMGINDAGQILALYYDYFMVAGSGNIWPRVRLVSGAGNLLLGENPDWPIASINRAGLMSGSQVNQATGAQSGAVFYGTASNSPILDVGVEPGQTNTRLLMANNLGQAVGHSDQHAVFYSNNLLVSIGALGGTSSSALGINDSGLVVGWADTPTDRHAFLYQHGVMQDLNSLVSPDSGWVLAEARAINSKGQIIANGTHHGLYRPALLTPIPPVVFVPGGGVRPEVLRIVPSPSSRGSAIEFGRPARDGGAIRIFDAQGREVRSFALRAGDRRLEWDGTSANGDRVVSGVYLVQARVDGKDFVGRAVLLR